jgi:hypothetical protein
VNARHAQGSKPSTGPSSLFLVSRTAIVLADLPGRRDLGWEPQWYRARGRVPWAGHVDQKPHDPVPAGGDF